MKFPRYALGAAKAALGARYDDLATVATSTRVGNAIEWSESGRDIPCHLSKARRAPMDRTGAKARGEIEYTLYFPVGTIVRPGDRIEVVSRGQRFCGSAGVVVHGAMSVRVPLDGVVIA